MSRVSAGILAGVILVLLTGCSATHIPSAIDWTSSSAVDTAALTPTHWVAATGNDSGPGTQAKPWKTLAKAASSVVPGDVVQVMPGSYRGFDLRRAGAKGKPIVFRGRVGRGAWVVINASNGKTPDGINVEESGWVVIDGFSVGNMPRAGVRVVTSPHVTVRNCRCRNNQRWGIFTGFTDYFVVENNTCSGSRDEHGIYVSNSSQYPIIRRNVCFANNECGIQINADRSMGPPGITGHALIERNIIYENGAAGGSAINCDGVCNSVIRNNLLYSNHASGISLYQIDGATGSRRNRVVNNTIVQAPDGRWCLNINTGSTGNAVRNNILLHTLSYRGSLVLDGSSLSGFTSDYNLVSGPFSRDGDATLLNLVQWRALGYDAHSKVTTAAQVFTNAVGGNYRPKAGGPAINAGTATFAPSNDLLGRHRPQGAGYDIGCYEGP